MIKRRTSPHEPSEQCAFAPSVSWVSSAMAARPFPGRCDLCFAKTEARSRRTCRYLALSCRLLMPGPSLISLSADGHGPGIATIRDNLRLACSSPISRSATQPGTTGGCGTATTSSSASQMVIAGAVFTHIGAMPPRVAGVIVVAAEGTGVQACLDPGMTGGNR